MTAKEVRVFTKKIDKTARVRGIKSIRGGVKHDAYIEAYFQTPLAMRKLALQTIYGLGFNADQNQWCAGNVSSNCITMTPEQWETLIVEWESA